MLLLNDGRSKVLRAALSIAGDELGIASDDWFRRAVSTCHLDDWDITETLNRNWLSCNQTEDDEARMYSSVEYALDICKCYTHWTRPSLNATIRGLLEIRKYDSTFADGWTFIDYFAGVGLGSIHLAQQLTAAGIDATVVYHNSERNANQVALAKRFYAEAGSPSNMRMHLTDDEPRGDVYMFYEVFEHMREPWAFTESLIASHRPKMVIHVSRFNLPNVSGHFSKYTIDGDIYSGKDATREFERRFKPCGYVRTVIPSEFNGIPRFQLHESVVPPTAEVRNQKWDLKEIARLSRVG